MTVPLVILAGLSIVGGFVQLPDTMGGAGFFNDLLRSVLPGFSPRADSHGAEAAVQLLSAGACLAGILAPDAGFD